MSNYGAFDIPSNSKLEVADNLIAKALAAYYSWAESDAASDATIDEAYDEAVRLLGDVRVNDLSAISAVDAAQRSGVFLSAAHNLSSVEELLIDTPKKYAGFRLAKGKRVLANAPVERLGFRAEGTIVNTSETVIFGYMAQNAILVNKGSYTYNFGNAQETIVLDYGDGKKGGLCAQHDGCTIYAGSGIQPLGYMANSLGEYMEFWHNNETTPRWLGRLMISLDKTITSETPEPHIGQTVTYTPKYRWLARTGVPRERIPYTPYEQETALHNEIMRLKTCTPKEYETYDWQTLRTKIREYHDFLLKEFQRMRRW